MAVLDVEINNGITLVRLNRPEARNALNPELIGAQPGRMLGQAGRRR